MDAKKISFGFSKTTKKQNLLQNKQSSAEENKVELIKCLEGQEIKLVEEKVEAAPLVIPMKEAQKTSGALLSLIKRRQVLLGDDLPIEDCELPEQDKSKVEINNSKSAHDAVNGTADTLEQRAAKELLAETKSNGDTTIDSQLMLPIVKADDLPLDGAKESTIDDYDSVPIQQFGLAMLRGMGWVEPPPKKVGPGVDEGPQVRPKGMGLGADKAVKRKPLLVPPEKNEVLEIKKQAYVRILGGKHKDLYGQIEGFDDFAGRVIVKMAIGGTKETFNEFLCQPVSRNEYAQYGKCINTVKYEEYKKMENEHGQIIIKKEPKNEPRQLKQVKKEENQSDKRSTYSERDYKSIRDHKSRERKDRHDDDETQCRQPISSSASSSSRGLQRKSRSIERAPYKSHANSKSQNRTPSSGDSSMSSQTDDSEADSAYGRKHKKSKSKRKSKKSKSKTRKHSKHRPRTPSSGSSSAITDGSRSSNDAADRRHKSHKKKTKKSKKQRERSRTRSRSRARR